MKVFSGEGADALMYLNARADDQLANAYAAMDVILSEYDAVLSKYAVPSGSVYRTKRTELATMFSSLKSSASELIRRTRTLISGTDSGYDSYYTAYCEQLQMLSERFESCSGTIGSEYDALINGLLGNDAGLIS